MQAPTCGVISHAPRAAYTPTPTPRPLPHITLVTRPKVDHSSQDDLHFHNSVLSYLCIVYPTCQPGRVCHGQYAGTLIPEQDLSTTKRINIYAGVPASHSRRSMPMHHPTLDKFIHHGKESSERGMAEMIEETRPAGCLALVMHASVFARKCL